MSRALSSFADRHVDPMAAVGVAIVAVSTSAILIRLSDAPSLVTAFYRILLMTATVAPFAFGADERASVRALSAREVGVIALSGIALACHFATWFESLRWTTVAASVTLVQTQPVFVALGAVLLLDERVSSRMAAGIAVALVGSAVMGLGGLLPGAGGAAPVYGDALAVVGAACAAAYVLAGRRVRPKLSLAPYTTLVYAVSTVTLLAFVLASGEPLLGYTPWDYGVFLALALGPGLFGHTVVNWALKYLESSVVSVSLLGEPVGSTILALLVFREVPDAATLLGGAVVLAGIVVTSRGRAT